MEFNEEKALGLIEKMILEVKRELNDNGFYFMLWGYLVFISAAVDYCLLKFDIGNHSLIWAILMPLGGVISIVKSIRDNKKKRVVTYIDEVLKHVLAAYGISLFIVCLIMPMGSEHWRSFYPTLMIVYAFGLYASGGIIQFKPLQFGAYAVWGFAIAAFFVGYDMQLLCLAAAVLLGFIIPGHMLNIQYKKDV